MVKVLIVEPQDFENWPRLLESCEAAGSEATFLADVDGHSKSFKVRCIMAEKD